MSDVVPDEPEDEATPGQTTNNQAQGAVQVLQAGTINGGVLLNARPVRPDLVDLWLTEGEIDELAVQDTLPGGWDRAADLLRGNRVVVLCGAGTGRTFTGRKILADLGHSRIAQLSRDRDLGGIEATELEPSAGYLWYAEDLGVTAFRQSDFDRVTHIVHNRDARLVVIVDSDERVPPEAQHCVVSLSRPDAVKVALVIVDRHAERLRDEAVNVLNEHFGHALHPNDPPNKAKRAAELAIDVAAGRLQPAEALAQLTDEIDRTVAVALQDLSVLEFSMALSIAIFENRPYDKVAEHAYRLDTLVRTAQLAADEELQPLEVFGQSKHDLLRRIGAKPVLRTHPTHSGLQEETVQFTTTDWAEAALRHVWREYLLSQEILLAWMCSKDLLDRFPFDCVRALCRVTTKVPSHDPLRMVDHLATRNSVDQRKLAAWTLVQLAEVHNLQPVVDERMEQWVDHGTPNRKATAAITCALRFGKDDPAHALEQLERLARNTSSTRVLTTVFEAVLYMLADAPDSRPLVVETVRTWLSTPKHTAGVDGLRLVGLAVGAWVTRLTSNPGKAYVEATELGTEFPDDVRFFARKVLDDREFGAAAVDRLAALATAADYDRMMKTTSNVAGAGKDLVEILNLLTPGLSWWRRRKTVVALCLRHPDRRDEIRWIFRVGHQLQRAQFKTDRSS